MAPLSSHGALSLQPLPSLFFPLQRSWIRGVEERPLPFAVCLSVCASARPKRVFASQEKERANVNSLLLPSSMACPLIRRGRKSSFFGGGERWGNSVGETTMEDVVNYKSHQSHILCPVVCRLPPPPTSHKRSAKCPPIQMFRAG